MESYLIKCKNLYLRSIHPFDLKYSTEYKKLIEIGTKYITQNGIQNFAEYLTESQYRVNIWTSKIILECENINPTEILKVSGKQTIKNICLECILKEEINELPNEIMENKTKWLIKTGYNNQLGV